MYYEDLPLLLQTLISASTSTESVGKWQGFGSVDSSELTRFPEVFDIGLELFVGIENESDKVIKRNFVKSRDSGCSMEKLYRTVRGSTLGPD